jgi:hypothetical protein
MSARIRVSVKGLSGLDDQDRVVRELKAATGLEWHLRVADRGRVLAPDIGEILLEALVGKAAEMSVEAAVYAVRKVIERWRRERLDPPETSVRTELLPDTDPGTNPGGDAMAAGARAAEGADG